MRRALEGARHRFFRTRRPHERNVVGRLVPDDRRARLARVGGRDDHGQRLEFHRHPLGGVGGVRLGVGDDERDGIADVADPLAREQRARRGERRRAVAALARAVGRHVAHAVGGEVGSREHREHAG